MLFSTIITMHSLTPATFVPRGLSRPLRVQVLRFLLLKWSPHDIAAECRVHPATVYRMARNLLQYGGIRAPAVRKLGRPRRLTTADEDAVLELLLSDGRRRYGNSSPRTSSSWMNLYSTRRRGGDIVPMGQSDKISAIPPMFSEAVHGVSVPL